MTVTSLNNGQANGPVAVSVQDVNMVFDGFHAVQSASFELVQGRFLTILGPSGSGKTTLLRMIAGFQKPSSGEIFINGAPVSAAPPHKRSIGMVFQKLALFPHMTAAENVAFPLKMRRFDARTIPERVQRYLDLVQLGPYADRHVHQLSGGQQQRVAIARALVFEPDLLLLDEPLAALDRKLREEMQLEFRRIQRELGVTTINVTHDQREALVVSDDVVVMDKGRIQQMASPAVTYRTPANAFVAGFIGVTNFLNGAVTAVDGPVVSFVSGAQDFAGHWGRLRALQMCRRRLLVPCGPSRCGWRPAQLSWRRATRCCPRKSVMRSLKGSGRCMKSPSATRAASSGFSIMTRPRTSSSASGRPCSSAGTRRTC